MCSTGFILVIGEWISNLRDFFHRVLILVEALGLSVVIICAVVWVFVVSSLARDILLHAGVCLVTSSLSFKGK